jgi:hypothetical protein
MATSSPPMTPPSLRRLPSGNLGPGRHTHSQTAAVSSRRGDERREAEKQMGGVQGLTCAEI